MSRTYSEIVALLPTEMRARNAGLEDAAAYIISRAEERLISMLDRDLFRRQTTLTVAAGVDTFSLAGGVTLDGVSRTVLSLTGVRAAAGGVSWPVMHRNAEALAALYSSVGDRGLTRYYTEDVARDTYRLAPVPDDDVVLTLALSVRPLPLGPTRETNELTALVPDALMASICYTAARWLQRVDELPAYLQDLTLAVGLVNKDADVRRRDEADVPAQRVDNRRGPGRASDRSG